MLIARLVKTYGPDTYATEKNTLRWLETLFEKCEKDGFEYDIVDYYRVLKGKEYHSGMQK